MSPKDFTAEDRKKISEIQSYLVNHLDEKHTIRTVARKAAMSKEKLKEGFQKMTGMGVWAYIHVSKLKTAHFFLLNTDKPIKEIAGMVGYGHTKNFLIAFKKYFKITAGSVRSKGD